MLDILTAAAELKTAKLANSGEMSYTNLPPAVRDVLAQWDTDGSGKIGAVELQAAARAQQQMAQMNKFLKAALFVLLLIVLLLVSMMFVSAEVSKDTKPDATGVTTLTSSDGTPKPMAVASIEEKVMMKDLWKPEFTVTQLKSMKTVTFETPSGAHVYSVVGVNRRTAGDGTETTTIYSSSGHQMKITKSSAILLYPNALTGETEGITDRRQRRLQMVNGRYVEQIFMLHKNGRRLSEAYGVEPACAMGTVTEWDPNA